MKNSPKLTSRYLCCVEHMPLFDAYILNIKQ